jgi:hypothetical protein
MNQTYIDAVKNAHNMCKELSKIITNSEEILQNSDEVLQKAKEFSNFAFDLGKDDWHVSAYIMKLALRDYELHIIAQTKEFAIYADEYRNVIMQNAPENMQCFLTEELMYLLDIKG